MEQKRTFQQLMNMNHRTRKDVVSVANQYEVSVSTIYRWIRQYEEKQLQLITGEVVKTEPRNTRFYRADPDYNNIIDQEIAHYKPLNEDEDKKLVSITTGFNRRYLTIKTTYKMIIKRIQTINMSRTVENQFSLPSYQAIWKRVKNRTFN